MAGVDGTDDGNRALRFAVDRARTLRTGIRFVHVVPPVTPMAGQAPRIDPARLDEVAEWVVKDATDLCGELAPDLPVSSSVRRDSKHHALVDESATAESLVLGGRSRTPFGLGPGSTTTLATVGAGCPVFSVPATWQPGIHEGPVVVGISHREEIEPLVRIAMSEARLRGVEVQLLHAWRPPGRYSYASGMHDEAARWTEATVRDLAEASAGVRAEDPDVTVSLRAEYLAPAFAVGSASTGASLVVLGQHHAYVPLIAGLGRVPHAAIQAGTAPVEIVPLGRMHSGGAEPEAW